MYAYIYILYSHVYIYIDGFIYECIYMYTVCINVYINIFFLE